MQYHVIKPEVAGGWGEHIIVDRSADPLQIKHLHYKFDGWLGDELLTTHPVYICTERVAAALQTGKLSGFNLADVEVSRTSQFQDLYSDRTIPPFRWLQVTGVAQRDDFGLRGGHLVVSERALSCLRSFPLAHADVRTVAEFEWDPDKRTDQLFAEAKARVEEMKRQKKTKK